MASWASLDTVATGLRAPSGCLLSIHNWIAITDYRAESFPEGHLGWECRSDGQHGSGTDRGGLWVDDLADRGEGGGGDRALEQYAGAGYRGAQQVQRQGGVVYRRAHQRHPECQGDCSSTVNAARPPMKCEVLLRSP